MSLFDKAWAYGCYGSEQQLEESVQRKPIDWNVCVCFSFWVELALVVTSFGCCYLLCGISRALILW